jgi:microcystin-dependent protein
MADPFVAEIRIFPFNFAPTGWAFCDGQLLPLSQNTALFSLLGTTYGGDGKSTFALPNLQGCAPMHPGQGAGLSERVLGQFSGVESVTLLESEIPLHAHTMMSANPIVPGDTNVPTGNAIAKSAGGAVYLTPPQTTVNLSPEALSPAGSDFPHNNMQPYLTLTFCIALQGVFPARP